MKSVGFAALGVSFENIEIFFFAQICEKRDGGILKQKSFLTQQTKKNVLSDVIQNILLSEVKRFLKQMSSEHELVKI